MSVKRTPGPWKFDTGLGCKGIKGGKCGSSRQAQYTDIAYTVGLSDEKQDEANARLISAAPDLLDVAKRIVEWMDDNGYSSIDQSFGARAAIAKAEGRS